MNMVRVVGVVGVAVMSLAASGFAVAQASSPERAAIKAQTKEAVRNRATTPAGEGVPDQAKAPDTKSSQTRAERKAQTRQAVRDGAIPPAGEGVKDEAKAPDTKSAKTRVERKAETRKARKEGKLVPAGESPTPAK